MLHPCILAKACIVRSMIFKECHNVFAVVFCVAALFTVSAFADPIVFTFQVGYADNLRTSGFFPNPWLGNPNITFFGAGPTFDAGAIKIDNTGTMASNITSLDVNLHPAVGGPNFSIWNFGSGFTVLPGQQVIFTQNAGFNFDSSDSPIVAPSTTNNCNTGPLALTSVCTTNAPLINFGINGTSTIFSDSRHVLDTFGYDLITTDVNESIGWNDVGTFHGHGNIPEPATMFLLPTGGSALLFLRRRQKKTA